MDGRAKQRKPSKGSQAKEGTMGWDERRRGNKGIATPEIIKGHQGIATPGSIKGHRRTRVLRRAGGWEDGVLGRAAPRKGEKVEE